MYGEWRYSSTFVDLGILSQEKSPRESLDRRLVGSRVGLDAEEYNKNLLLMPGV
jgi:hypothetical protein